MTLGDIFSEGESIKAVGRPVEFHLVRNGRQYKCRAELYPVGEQARHEANRAALKYLRSLPAYRKQEDGTEPPIPILELRHEETYKFLQAALRDADDANRQFVGADDYGGFRGSITAEQVGWLNREYERLMTEQYPEILGEQQRKEIEDEAAGK